LASSGNVPSLVGGSAQTINSGSISPNSSASEAEVRKVQKDLTDLTECMERLRCCLDRNDIEGAKVVAAGKTKNGDCDESLGLTIPEDGVPSVWYGEGDGGYVAADGRFHSVPDDAGVDFPVEQIHAFLLRDHEVCSDVAAEVEEPGKLAHWMSRPRKTRMQELEEEDARRGYSQWD